MKQLILAVDIQNEYITEGRPFYIPNIQESLNNIEKIFSVARDSNILIWHMQHKQTGSVFSAASKLCDFIPGFEPKNGELSFVKDMYSCFSSPDFLEKINQFKPDEIIVVGYGSSMCCTCTIIDGIHRGFKFVLAEDATASKNTDHAPSEFMHQSAINILKQYAKIVSSLHLLNLLSTLTVKPGVCTVMR